METNLELLEVPMEEQLKQFAEQFELICKSLAKIQLDIAEMSLTTKEIKSIL